jgi:signal transduction histidine kinase
MSRFLIVDDNPQNLYQLHVLLQGHGHTVESALNGEEALDKARQSRPDVIITDVLMPIMDGFTLCRHWQADEQLRTIPLVVYTATYTDAEDEELALSLGATRFLIKPLEPEEFMSAIEDVLRQHQSGQLTPSSTTTITEPQYLKMYNEALVRKLEDKISDLEREIAKRQQIEEALLQAKERAEIANRVKSEFLAMMSHELRTPLHVILGYADLLLEDTFGELSNEQSDVLRRLQRSGRTLLERLSLALDLRRLEDGRFPLEVAEVHLFELVLQVEEEMPELRQQPDVRYLRTVAATLPPLRTDPGKLRLILRNLLSNALKFTEAGSVSLVVTSEDNGVSIAITDTGIGIPTHALSEIFEPFYQVTDVNEPRRGGVGLGLHIVKRLLDLLGGRITVDSKYGRGSIFTVQLPWDGPPEES